MYWIISKLRDENVLTVNCFQKDLKYIVKETLEPESKLLMYEHTDRSLGMFISSLH